MAYNPNYLGKLASDPGSPIEGQLYYNTTVRAYRYYNGTAWEGVGGIILPDGSNLLGTYTGSTLVAGNATLTADTVIQGDLFVEGSLTNTGGYALTVKGDCFVGQFFFSPTSTLTTQKSVSVVGNMKIGPLILVGPDTIVANMSDGSYGGYFNTATDLNGLGYISGQDNILIRIITGANAGQVDIGTLSGANRIYANINPGLNPGDQAIIEQINFTPHFRANSGQIVSLSVGGDLLLGVGTQFDCTGQGNTSVTANGLAIYVGGNLIGSDAIVSKITADGTLLGNSGTGGNGGTLNIGGNMSNMFISSLGSTGTVQGGNGGSMFVGGNISAGLDINLAGQGWSTAIGGNGGMLNVLGFVDMGQHTIIMDGGNGITGGHGGTLSIGGDLRNATVQMTGGDGLGVGPGGNGGTISHLQGCSFVTLRAYGGPGTIGGNGANNAQNIQISGEFANCSFDAHGGAGSSGAGGNAASLLIAAASPSFQAVDLHGGNGTTTGGNGGIVDFTFSEFGDVSCQNITTNGGNGGSGAGGNGGNISCSGNFTASGSINSNGGTGTGNGTDSTLSVIGNCTLAQAGGGIHGTIGGNFISTQALIVNGNLTVGGDLITPSTLTNTNSYTLSIGGNCLLGHGTDISGTIAGDVFINGFGTLRGNTMVNGDMNVAGDLTNTRGYGLTVNGDLIICAEGTHGGGGMHFSPDSDVITQGSVQISGDLFISLDSDFRINPGVGYVQIGVGGTFMSQQVVVQFDGSGNATGGSGNTSGSGLFIACQGDIIGFNFNLNGADDDGVTFTTAGDGGTLYSVGGDIKQCALSANGGNVNTPGDNPGNGGQLHAFSGDLTSNGDFTVNGGNDNTATVGGGSGGTLIIGGIASPQGNLSVSGGAGLAPGTDGTITTRIILDQNGNFLFNTDNVRDIGSPDSGTTFKRPRDVYIGRNLIVDGVTSFLSGVRAGKSTLVNGTVTIPNVTVTSNSIVLLTYASVPLSGGFLTYTIIPGTSFTITSITGVGATNIADNSTIAWSIVETH